MQYISSDTNVWIDFFVINRLEYPFRLSYTYIMNDDALSDELLSPKGLKEELRFLGLQGTELTIDEFLLAEEYLNRYSKPSRYDCIALAIAKNRNIVLLSGDGPLRKAAMAEGVTVMGTIGVLDQLYESQFINIHEYLYCLQEFLKYNGGKIRLPEIELKKRIEKVLLELKDKSLQ